MRRPLAWLVVIFCGGIVFASKIKIPFLPVYWLALISLFLSFISVKKELIFKPVLLLLVFSLGASLLRNSQTLPQSHVSKFLYYKNRFFIIRGFVATQPVIKNKRTTFIFKTKEAQSANLKFHCCGDILVYLKGQKDLYYLEELILSGKLYRPFTNAKDHKPSYRDYLSRQGIYAVMSAKISTKLNQNRAFTLKGLAFWLKNYMEAIILKHLAVLPAAILDAMVLGERKNIPALVNDSMIKSGTVHILVVSGFNVGIIAFIFVLFLKLIRIPRQIRFFIAMPLLILYCLLTGASTPVVRATVMALVFMFSYFIKREPDIYNSCAIAAIFILLLNPNQLFDIGFQLSFASVISIVYLYPKIKSFLRLKKLKLKYIKYPIEGGVVSFSAWLGTMGFIAYYFQIFSPITVLANIFIVPLASLITFCGFSLIAMHLICPPLVPFFASSSELVVTFLVNLNAFLIKLPGAYFSLS